MKDKTVVIKIGSSVLAPGAKLDKSLLNGIVSNVNALIDEGVKVCLVSSGAIACGVQALGLNELPENMNRLQAVASVGQVKLMDAYNSALSDHKKIAAQVLLTWDDFQDKKRFINAKHTFSALFDDKILPIINENDTVAIDEIKFGDNDNLSALVAGLVEADLLLILSNVDGFISDGEVLSSVCEIDENILKCVVKKTSAFTKGGMDSKLQAVKLATSFGIKTILANGHAEDVVKKIVLEKEHIGTLFHPSEKLCAETTWSLIKELKKL